MKLRDTKLHLFILILFTLCTSNASAVTWHFITDADLPSGTGAVFEGNATGDFGDVYWENVAGSNLVLTDFYGAGVLGLNTSQIASSSGFLEFDTFALGTFLDQGFVRGSQTFAGPLTFGSNNFLTDVTHDIQIVGSDAVVPSTRLLSDGGGAAGNFITINSNNTYSFGKTSIGDSILLVDDEFSYVVSNNFGFYLTRDQSQNVANVFNALDPSVFLDPFPDPMNSDNDFNIDVDRLIANFEFLIAALGDTEWTLLAFEAGFYTATELNPENGMDPETFVGITTLNYFSLDEGAIPTPIPAAVWLFGTGLFGMVAFARRKSGATKL